jgi:preprotein translocase subunit SecF
MQKVSWHANVQPLSSSQPAIAFLPIPRYPPHPMSFIRLSKFFLPLSGLLVLASVVLFFYPGPQISIEFTGGTLMEIQIPEEQDKEALQSSLVSFNASLAVANIARTRTGTYFVRIPTLTNEEHAALLGHLEDTLGSVEELQYTTIGPTVGNTLKRRAFYALALAAVAIAIYLAAAFRKIPRHLNPWTFGFSAILALLHDIIITVGIFTIISYYTTFQIDTLFITALLSIMGYSVNDTIVIFDRLRSNLFIEGKKTDLTAIADRSLMETVSRTINTGIGALIMLFALFFFGSESIRWFILALIVGTLIGTYSSFFVATPILVFWQKKRK